MFSLLVFSLVLLAPAAAAEKTAPGNLPLSPSQSFDQVQPNGPAIIEEGPLLPFDPMEIHPDPDTCYRIRAYIFSQGRHPKFLRETTCGPSTPSARKMDGMKPGVMPLEMKAKPAVERERDIPAR